jgi:uncharacterized cupin superfamily protein
MKQGNQSMRTIVKLDNKDKVQPITENLEGWVVTAGNPTMKTWVLHTSVDGSMVSGHWESTPGSYHATYTAYEFVHVMEGRMTITPDGGEPVHIGPGDAFAVEANFKGVWTIHETIRKHFLVPGN